MRAGGTTVDELVARSPNGEIAISLTWLSDELGSTGAEATRGALTVSLRGRPVWFGEDEATGFEWSWIELLEFLAEYWLYLSVEEGPPLGVAPDTAPRMFAAAEAAIESGTPLGSDFEREQLEAYRVTHDLAEAVQGAVLPPLWIVRQGKFGWVASTTMTASAPFDEVLDVLRRVGDVVALRLNGATDERSIRAVQSWRDRGRRDRLEVIEAATGFPPELVVEVESAFYGQNERDWSILAPDELLAAARLVGPQPPTTLRPILTAIRQVPKRDCSELDCTCERAMAVVADLADEPPYAQGHELARWLRSQPNVVHQNGRVDPDTVLDSWRVPVVDVDLDLADIDAIGCWGPKHGPAVLLNAAPSYAGSAARRRATLAHEICHLLVDRLSSLPLVEVLGGRTGEHVEKRARAFVAELLLPRHIAGEALSATGDSDGAVRSLRSRFGVSSELVAWQVRNSNVTLPPQMWRYLRSLVSRPSRFGLT
jgi:Zn-dependent peptidase ImmA (M78 family)